MTSQATKYVVSLGLLAGSLAIAPESYAQIQVTGGEANGEAAFFVPTITPEGNIRLFDTSIQELRIETPNGVTTTSVFTPGAADFDDANLNGLPDRGDTGTLQGVLSGVAFTQTGTPIAFSNRPTLLNFTLSDFTANIGTLNGTLVRSEVPGEAPLVFLPGVDSDSLDIASPGFVGDGGTLQIGEFSSDLDDGVIALPPNLIFRDSNGVTPVSPLTLARRIKFEFEGEEVIPDIGTDFGPFSDIIIDDDDDLDDDSIDDDIVLADDDDLDDSGLDDDDLDNDDDLDDDDDDLDDDDDDLDDEDVLRFVGDVNQRFRIQSIGTQANQEFQIFGSFGSLDLTLGSISEADVESEGVLSTDVETDYRVRGDSEGIFSFFGTDSYSFASTGESDTKFEFEQAEGSLEGRSEGEVSFYAASGLGTLPVSGDFDDETGGNITIIDTTVIDLSAGSNSTCNFCGNNLVNNTTVNVDNTVVRVGQPVVVNVTTSPGRSSQTVNNINQTFTITNNISFEQIYSVNSDLFALSGSSPSAVYLYSFLGASRYYLLSDYTSTVSIEQISIDVVNQGNSRYYLVMDGLPGRRLALGRQRDSVLVAYQQIGPDCKIFPGLVGLREIDVDDLDDDYFDDDISLDDESDDLDDDLDNDSDDSDDLDDDAVDSIEESDEDSDDLGEDSDDSIEESEDDTVDSIEESDDESDDSIEESEDDTVDSVEESDDESDDSVEESEDDTVDSVEESDDESDDLDDSADDSTDDTVESTDDATEETETETETESVDGIQGLEEL